MSPPTVIKFESIWIQNAPARPRGWYVRDVRRSTPYAMVVVGGKHMTNIEAQSEARRLEIEERIR